MKFCMSTFPVERRSTMQEEKKGETHDMIPKAWYSIIDERLIRPSNPCCIPRLKRMMATFGEGWRHSAYYFWYDQVEE